MFYLGIHKLKQVAELVDFFSQTLVLAEQKMSNGAMISGSNFIVQCAPLSKLPPAIATQGRKLNSLKNIDRQEIF